MATISLWSLASYARVNVIFTGVHAGEPFIQPSIASKLLMDVGRKGRVQIGQSSTLVDEELSGREAEVLKLLAAGSSNREIAERLTLAEGTVKNHVSNILSKLHAENRTQAANLARERKLISVRKSFAVPGKN
ncbi:MAG TPA: response regulator transcription factor [Ktedonobacteraceae bacterium]